MDKKTRFNIDYCPFLRLAYLVQNNTVVVIRMTLKIFKKTSIFVGKLFAINLSILVYYIAISSCLGEDFF